MNEKVLTSSSNCGIGLWTAICMVFCSIFGKESKAVLAKQYRVSSAAISSLNGKIKVLGSSCRIKNVSTSYAVGMLSVTATATALVEMEEAEEKPSREKATKQLVKEEDAESQTAKKLEKEIEVNINDTVRLKRNLVIGKSSYRKGLEGTVVGKGERSVTVIIDKDLIQVVKSDLEVVK